MHVNAGDPRCFARPVGAGFLARYVDRADIGWEFRTVSFFSASDGTRIFYQDWGSGDPVVFTHSWLLDSNAWEYQFHALVEAGLRCIGLDRRGHGRSDVPGTGYDYDTLADDLAGLLEHLDLRGATMVGHSMGGGEIVRYVTRHGRQRVARVALVAATLPAL